MPLKPYSSAICVLLICRLFLSLVHTSWKLAGNCLLICHSQADRDDGDGIVWCGKRLSISLVFHWQKHRSSSRGGYTQYTCVLVGWVAEHESALWWQIISCLFYCDHLSVRVCLCVCAHLAHRASVSVLPLFSLSAAYQLTMATNGAPLTAAGLMSVVTAHCQPIIINRITTQRGNGMVSKRPFGDLRFPFLPLCESLHFGGRKKDILPMITINYKWQKITKSNWLNIREKILVCSYSRVGATWKCRHKLAVSPLMHASALAVDHQFLSLKASVQFLFSAGKGNNHNRFKGLLC